MRRTVKYNDNISFADRYLKRHNCPYCGGRMQVRYKSTMVNSQSAEGRKSGIAAECGAFELRTVYFYCTGCSKTLSVEDVMEIKAKKAK